MFLRNVDSMDNTVMYPRRKKKLFITTAERTSNPTRGSFIYANCISLTSAVGIATGYGMDDRGIEVRVPAGDFSPLQVVQTGSRAHSASYSVGI
jgi:hypothetical protein